MIQKHKCTLVPSRYFEERLSRCVLSDLYALDESEAVRFLELPRWEAVLVYTSPDESMPELYGLLQDVDKCSEYNKILVSHSDGFLNLVIAQGERLLLANVYPAADFTTAQYYIFFAMKSLQLNPEVSVISVKSPLGDADEMSLYRYFKSVERI